MYIVLPTLLPYFKWKNFGVVNIDSIFPVHFSFTSIPAGMVGLEGEVLPLLDHARECVLQERVAEVSESCDRASALGLMERTRTLELPCSG